MNHLESVHQLRNHYYVMRHGQSKANLKEIIVSHPKNGKHADYTLTDLGQKQAYDSAKAAELTRQTVIYSSDFSRALDTAKIVRQVLGAPSIHIAKELRERNFGDYEGTNHDNYHKVWERDKDNANHNEQGVESVSGVVDRVTSFITDIDKNYNGKDILLVSHGDILQILQTAFQKISPTKHRSLPHLETAEIRELELK